MNPAVVFSISIVIIGAVAIAIMAITYKNGGSGKYATVGALCADMDAKYTQPFTDGVPDFERYGEMTEADYMTHELCKELKEVRTTDKIMACEDDEDGTHGTSDSAYADASEIDSYITFTMDEILSAEDPTLKMQEIHAKCTDARRLKDGFEIMTEAQRKTYLAGYFGWCSTDFSFMTGGADSADYNKGCNKPKNGGFQDCKESGHADDYSCGHDISTKCCTVHDSCLNGQKCVNSGNGGDVFKNFSGNCCDAGACSCSNAQSCKCQGACYNTWFGTICTPCISGSCIVTKALMAGGFCGSHLWKGYSAQSGFNAEGLSRQSNECRSFHDYL